MTATIQISDERVRDLLCGAFEGGSNYWYMIERRNYAPGVKGKDFLKGGKLTDPKQYWHPCQLIPLHPGCSLTISDQEDDAKKEYTLDRAAIERGVQVMAEKFTRHFSNVVNENDDATTADVFLQCCLFGDVIYG
jgi:hypothetical protein